MARSALPAPVRPSTPPLPDSLSAPLSWLRRSVTRSTPLPGRDAGPTCRFAERNKKTGRLELDLARFQEILRDMHAHYDAEQISTVVAQADSDGDGMIGKREFKRLVRRLLQQSKRSREAARDLRRIVLADFYRHLDTDNSGCISREEIQVCSRTMDGTCQVRVTYMSHGRTRC